MSELEEKVRELFAHRLGPVGTFDHVHYYFALVDELKTGRYGDPGPGVETYLTHPDDYVADQALCVLFDVDVERAIDYSLLHIMDPDPDHQFAICQLLADHAAAERAVLPLVEVLRSSQDPSTRYVAVEALHNFGDERAIPALEHTRRYDRGRDWEGRKISEMAAEAIEVIRQRARR